MPNRMHNVAEINPYISIIVINENKLKSIVKRQGIRMDFLKIIYISYKRCIQNMPQKKLKEQTEKLFQKKANQKKTGIAKTSNKIVFK